MRHRLLWAETLLACLLLVADARAQLGRGDLRVGLDTDVLSVGTVRLDPNGPERATKDTVVSVGPNALGSSQRLIVTAPLGVDIGYAIRAAWMLDVRTGFGYDRVALDGVSDSRNVYAVSVMPSIKFVPLGDRTKLFVHFSPVFQYNRATQGSAKDHLFVGCFSAGAGMFIFTAPRASVDVGGYFEGRFGKFRHDPGNDREDISDMRGIIRIGVSYWRRGKG